MDYLVRNPPLDLPTGTSFHQRELSKFINGNISENQLIQTLNFPRLAQMNENELKRKTQKNTG